MKRLALGSLPLVAIILVAYLFWPREGGLLDGRRDPELVALREEAERGRSEGRKAVRQFRPKVEGDIRDLATDARAVVSALPFVVHVERLGPSGAPSHRIIHLRYTPVAGWEDFVAMLPKDMKQSEIDRRYERYQLEAAIDHGYAGAALACLVRYHSLDRVLVDDFTDDDIPWWTQEVQELGAKVAVKRQTEMSQAAKDDLGNRVLHLGPVGPLAVAGLVRPMPAEEREAYLAAEPKNGLVNEEAMRNRLKGIVRRCQESGAVSVLQLDGQHDLRGVIPNGVEYLRVTAKGYRGADAR